MRPLTWREWVLCAWVVPAAIAGAIYSHFKEHWENRNLPLRQKREQYRTEWKARHSRV